MYRDSQHGLTIDLAGLDGNVYALMGFGNKWCRQLGRDQNQFMRRMMESDYNHALDVFDDYFGNIVTFLNDPREVNNDPRHPEFQQ